MTVPLPKQPVPSLHLLPWSGVMAGFSTAMPWPHDKALSQTLEGCFQRDAIQHSGAPLSAPPTIAILHQHHSTELVEWQAQPNTPNSARSSIYDAEGKAIIRGDGLISTAAGVCLCIKTADCVPVLAFEPHLKQCAALHAGWRGVAGGILARLVTHWLQQGGAVERIQFALGPHIMACCFEVQEDCLDQFSSAWLLDNLGSKQGRTYLSLEGVLQTQLRELGGSKQQVKALQSQQHCTRCFQSPNARYPYASHRRRLATPQAIRPARTSNLSLMALLP